MIEPLRPDLLALEPTPFCEAQVQLLNQIGATDYYRRNRRAWAEEHGTTPDKCKRRSSWRIDGACLCGLHAGRIALKKLWEQEQGKHD